MSSFQHEHAAAIEHASEPVANVPQAPRRPATDVQPPDTILAKPAASSGGPSPAHVEMTGNAFADEGLACDGEQRKGECFLDATTRNRVVALYQGRVNAAHLSYMSALTQLGVEELLAKEPATASWMMELLLDVIGALTSNVALKVFKHAIGGAHAIEGVVANAADVSVGLTAHGEGLFKEGFGLAVSAAKREITKAEAGKTDPSKPEIGTAKAANIIYIDLLKDQSGTIYENIREGMLAGIDDARLLVLFDSFRAANHTVSAYKTALSQKLQRFKKSGLGKLGVSRNEKYGQFGNHGIDAAQQHEKHAYWVRMPTGLRLGLYKRVHQLPRDTVRELSGADRNKTEFELLADKMQRGTNEDGFVFDGFVPVEFADAAAKMHAAKWGYAPRERVAGPYELMQMGTKDQQS